MAKKKATKKKTTTKKATRKKADKKKTKATTPARKRTSKKQAADTPPIQPVVARPTRRKGAAPQPNILTPPLAGDAEVAAKGNRAGESETPADVTGKIEQTLPSLKQAASAKSGEESLLGILRNALEKGESRNVAFMHTAGVPEFPQTICALANTAGGTVFVGVRDGRVTGTDRKYVDEVTTRLSTHLDDPLPTARTVEIHDPKWGMPVVAVVVENSTEEVALADLTIWERRGSKNVSHKRRIKANRQDLSHASSNLGLHDKVQVEVVRGTSEEDAPSPEKLELEQESDQQESPTRVGTAFDLRREAKDEEKCLNVDEYADALAAYFDAAEDDEMCFGLFGHWGRGKTFLVNEVAERLKDKGCAAVAFSAWKYRTTPELWAYLYETISASARRDVRLPWLLPIRSGLARFGVWPLIWAVFAFGVSLFSVADRFETLFTLSRIIGVAGLLFLLFVAVRLRTLGKRLQKQYASLASHRQTLGLQAAIGDDLRALLIAWMPKDYWLDLRACWNSIKALDLRACWNLITANGLRLVFYLLSTGFVAFQLHPHWHRNSVMPGWLPGTIWGVWLLLAFVVPWFVLLADTRCRRLFLYVDDLDRCPSQRMLEIIESVMLMLDDPEMKRRVQVCMLVEEESIDHALKVKYRHLIQDEGETAAKLKEGHVVRENLEKLFISHLRLPELGTADVAAVLKSYLGESAVEIPEENQGVATEAAEIEEVAEHGDNGEQSTDDGKDRVAELQESVPFTDAERRILLELILEHKNSGHPGRWTPRAIRCLLSRYQLARTLLKSLGVTPTPTALARALIIGPDGDGVKSQPDQTTAIVVDQVR